MPKERSFRVSDHLVIIGKPGGEGLTRPAPLVTLSYNRWGENWLRLVDTFSVQEARELAQTILAAAEYAEFGWKEETQQC